MVTEGGSFGKPAIYYFPGGFWHDAENPRKVYNGRPFADFVHVQGCGEQTLARASDAGESMGGAGGFQAILDLCGRTNQFPGGGNKRVPCFAVGQLFAYCSQYG